MEGQAAASASAPLLINLTSMLLDGGETEPQRKPTDMEKANELSRELPVVTGNQSHGLLAVRKY